MPSLRLRQWRHLRLEVFCRNCLILLRSLPLRNKCIPFALKIIEHKIAVGDTVYAKVAQALTQLTPRHDHDVVHIVDENKRPDDTAGFARVRISIENLQLGFRTDRSAKT